MSTYLSLSEASESESELSREDVERHKKKETNAVYPVKKDQVEFKK